MTMHLLEAFNPIVGRTAFVGLFLPEPWRLSRAVVTPDVQTTVREGEQQWVASGETRHVLVHGVRRTERADLMVRVTPGAARRPLASRVGAESGALTVGGHPGEFHLGRRRDGWFTARMVPVVRVRTYCPRTRRTVLLEVTGQLPPEELRALLDAFQRIACHSGP
ncbi:MAG: hypothetical protein QN152_01090 [Armatimonadota bacterium]|nr:hypothetical protein [Armatimonadota bacterium]MDR7426587.1 hypothetical protein [Armatimonadota bacterium]MDR7463686.1 hypothetical protein [Armatimonadota bacterium]MDR7468607.1 hypothetical protein [Armatimonadota bacterium]MDR7473730.1 hypothetical protein [Armatimonadota bacterium]